MAATVVWQCAMAGLVVNVAILVFLVWKKRLFGIRGGPRSAEPVDREALFGPPVGSVTRSAG